MPRQPRPRSRPLRCGSRRRQVRTREPREGSRQAYQKRRGTRAFLRALVPPSRRQRPLTARQRHCDDDPATAHRTTTAQRRHCNDDPATARRTTTTRRRHCDDDPATTRRTATTRRRQHDECGPTTPTDETTTDWQRSLTPPPRHTTAIPCGRPTIKYKRIPTFVKAQKQDADRHSAPR